MGKIPSPPVIQKAMDLTGSGEVIPYFLHALANVAAAEVGARELLSAEDIEKAYYNRLLGPQGSIFFRDFLLREKAYPNTCRPGALAAR